MIDDFKVLETWTDDQDASMELRYYESHPSFDNERTIMLVVENHGIEGKEGPFFGAFSFTEDFGKGIGPEVIEHSKKMIVRAYTFERDKHFFESERLRRRQEMVKTLDKRDDV